MLRKLLAAGLAATFAVSSSSAAAAAPPDPPSGAYEGTDATSWNRANERPSDVGTSAAAPATGALKPATSWNNPPEQSGSLIGTPPLP